MDVLIKGVEEEVWKKFKITAIKRNRKISELFNELVKNVNVHSGNWDKIKKHTGLLNDREAEEIKKATKDFRKNFKFRY